MHDLRMQILHRHSYSFVESLLYMDVLHYRFNCRECVKYGQTGNRLIKASTFWHGREERRG